MTALVSYVLALDPWVVLLVVFALPALESSAFFGFIFPGEVALILGGVVASQGRVPLVAVLAAGILGAIVGDSLGFGFGRRYGRRLLNGTLGRFVKSHHLDRAEKYLAERGGRAVFFGRFTATLRVMIPGLVGMSGLRYRTFLTYNVASGLIWGTFSVLLGYLGGSSWRHVEHIASGIGVAALAAFVLAVCGGLLVRRSRSARFEGDEISPNGSHATEGLPGDIPQRRTVVVVPTYNEAGNVITLLDRVRVAAPDVDVLVVDDSSPDGTAALVTAHPSYADGRIHLLSRATKDGLGAAYRAGFRWALDHDYDAIVQMDADLSHPTDRIPALLAALHDADIAVGSRYVPGGQVSNWPLSRRLISWLGNLYVRLVLGLAVHDMTAGFKAFRREALVRIGAVDSSSNGYCFQVENTWRAARLGLTIAEVPITFTDRNVGASKMSSSIVAEALWRVLAWRWDELRAGAAATRLRALIRPMLTREVLTFLAVGGTGYVVDVVGFNVLRTVPPLAAVDPSIARTLAFIVAMWVTYIGNRTLTWRGYVSGDRHREVGLFVLFNLIGFGFSVVALAVSHDVLGMTGRLADNISANVVGVGLGTVFRFLTYKRFVFKGRSTRQPSRDRLPVA